MERLVRRVYGGYSRQFQRLPASGHIIRIPIRIDVLCHFWPIGERRTPKQRIKESGNGEERAALNRVYADTNAKVLSIGG